MKKTMFHVEVRFSDGNCRTFLVEERTYEAAIELAQPHVPAGTWKLLGVYEKMETEKKLHARTS